MIRIVFVSALAALVMAPFPTTGTNAPEPLLHITNAPAGYVFPDDHMQQCDDQLALVVTDDPGCVFEQDVRDGLGYLAVGFRSVNAGNTGPIPFTGLLTAHLSSDTGDMRWTCSWRNGMWSGCSIEPQPFWPEYGSPFTYDCYSESIPTSGPDRVSRGHWGECFVAHS